jgi:hypothetical protein
MSREEWQSELIKNSNPISGFNPFNHCQKAPVVGESEKRPDQAYEWIVSKEPSGFLVKWRAISIKCKCDNA